MKHTFHIETGQYEFLEQEFEGTTEEACAAYQSLVEAYRASQRPPEGLPEKEWREFVDALLTGKLNGDPGILENLSIAQKWFVQEARKSINRRK